MKRLRLPSPGLVVGLAALFVALSGTAVAALNESAPVASATVRLASGAMNPTSEGAFRSGCLAGERAIAGGWHQHGSGTSKGVFSLDDAPSEDLSSWNVYLVNTDDQPARVDVFAVCAK
jgi:hypothetical protein